MSGAGLQIRVDDVWLASVAAFGGVEVRYRTNGPDEATWSMALGDSARPSCLRRGAVVEIYEGPQRVFPGVLGQPDWDSKEFVAIGSARLGESAHCLTAAGAVTSKPNTAIDQAKARGVVDWHRAADFGNTDIAGAEGGAGVDDPDPGMLVDLLNLRSDEQDDQWRVLDDRRVVIADDNDADPKWFILPGAGVLGVADDDVTDRVFLRYFDSGAGRLRTASYPASTPPGGVERKASVVARGPMNSTRATNIAKGIYNGLLAGQTGWSNSLEVTEAQVVTAGGLQANLALVRAGDTVRMLGTVDPRSGRGYLDFVIEESIWRPAEKKIQLDPVGLARRTLEDVLTQFRATGAE